MKNANNNNQCVKSTILRSQLLEIGIDIEEYDNKSPTLYGIAIYNQDIGDIKNLEKILSYLPNNCKNKKNIKEYFNKLKKKNKITIGSYTQDIAYTIINDIKNEINKKFAIYIERES